MPTPLAIVVVVAHEARAAGQHDQDEQAGDEMGLGRRTMRIPDVARTGRSARAAA